YLFHLKTRRLISLRIPDCSCTHYLTNSLTILYSFSHLLKYDIIKVSNCAWDGAFFMPFSYCFVFPLYYLGSFLLCGNSSQSYMLLILLRVYTCVPFQGLTATCLHLLQS